ncbi:MAG: hypothetical protein JWM80_2905 [Cyanobacteria bacterium RYN_339]|nr:hypothetical protein [Cyanobacteria bacterium RYN_339]
MPIRVVLFLALLASVSACGRHVTSVGLAADPAFAALDADGDGKVSLVESHMALLAFQAADRNGDGGIDVLEWQSVGDASGIVAQRQRDREDQRDVMDPHRTGSTVRGSN